MYEKLNKLLPNEQNVTGSVRKGMRMGRLLMQMGMKADWRTGRCSRCWLYSCL